MDRTETIVLTCIDHRLNKARFYALSLQPTLFGEQALVRHWGRLGTRGRYKIELHTTSEEAYRALLNIAATKRRRGYLAKTIGPCP